MKRLVFLFVVCLINTCLSGQFLQDKVTGKAYQEKDYSEVQGSPLLLGEWCHGVIYLKDGYRADKFLLNFNVYRNELLFQYDNVPLVVVNPVKEFILEPSDGKKYLFRCGYQPVNANNENTFYQVLQDGPVALLKLLKKSITEVNEYNKSSKNRKFENAETYFIAQNGVITKIKKERNSLLNALGDKDGKLEAWMEKQKVKCRSEDELAAAVKAYNEF